MQFDLYTADTCGDEKNSLYPHKRTITDAKTLSEAVAFDNACGKFKNNHRSLDDFISCNCIMMDIDNDESDDPDEWVAPERVSKDMEDVQLFVVPSRNNMKIKNGKAARPKMHVGFPVDEMTEASEVGRLKRAIRARFPYFDGNALDASRLFYGAPCREDEVLWQDGFMDITEIVDLDDEAKDNYVPLAVIPEGQRNNTLSRFAARVLKRYGNTEKALDLFKEEAKKCDPPMGNRELKTIYSSAIKFYEGKVKTSKGYRDPADYNLGGEAGYLKPDDYTDVGEAKVFVREFGDEIISTTATGFLRYDGMVWNESEEQAILAFTEFLDLQLVDSMELIAEKKQACIDAGIEGEPDSLTKGKIGNLTGSQADAYAQYLDAKRYYTCVIKHRDMRNLSAALKHVKAQVSIDVNKLDANPYLLNTPAGTLDLRKGLSSLREHRAEDYITKITKASPSDEGMDIWLDQIDKTFRSNADTIKYVQLVFGEMVFGEVENEHLYIAHGGGRNGKSTICNSCAAILGSYSGLISAEALTQNAKRNVMPEIAEIKGKRVIIASELEENQSLSTSVIKKLCSTDPIRGEKKYERPFDFLPTHSVLLFTNHLPRVGALDEGTWRRLIVIPFFAKFEGKNDIRNYTKVLKEKAGGAILSWIVEGAKAAYEIGFAIKEPDEVKDAIGKYRQDNDWLAEFIDDYCEVGDTFEQPSGAFYDFFSKVYQRYSLRNKDSATFYSALETKGFRRKKTSKGHLIVGVRLVEEKKKNLDEMFPDDDFLE